jgi:hypothetical protein
MDEDARFVTQEKIVTWGKYAIVRGYLFVIDFGFIPNL